MPFGAVLPALDSDSAAEIDKNNNAKSFGDWCLNIVVVCFYSGSCSESQEGYAKQSHSSFDLLEVKAGNLRFRMS